MDLIGRTLRKAFAGTSGGRACARFAPCLGLLVALAGCQAQSWRGQEPEITGSPSARQGNVPFCSDIPYEKAKCTLPTYTLEPPDILLIEVIKLVPKAPYHFEPLDVLQILVSGTLPDQPISGSFPIDPSGSVDLGPGYGKVHVADLTSDEAIEAIKKFLEATLQDPQVSVSLLQSSAQQQITGEHLIGPDGTISLGVYGRVYVANMTIIEATRAIEDQLHKFLESPKIAVDVFSYNSKVYYIIMELAGAGDTVVRIPITGNETVLDALSQVNGLSRNSSKNIWIARPAPGGVGCDQILPVNWYDIVRGGATATNYQILPGDRLFVAQDKMIGLEFLMTKITGPFERIFGFSLLGAQTVQTMNRFPLGTTGGVL